MRLLYRFRQCNPRILHDKKEGPVKSSANIIDLLQSTQTTELSETKHASRQTTIRRQ